MSERDEFEAWAEGNGIYGGHKRIAQRAWQSARAHALEEAARVCEAARDADTRYFRDNGFHPLNGGASGAADRIRALARGE